MEERKSLFPVGGSNDAFAQYFVGKSYLKMLTTVGVPIGNVTFEPGCRNNWHIHRAGTGGGLQSDISGPAPPDRNTPDSVRLSGPVPPD